MVKIFMERLIFLESCVFSRVRFGRLQAIKDRQCSNDYHVSEEAFRFFALFFLRYRSRPTYAAIDEPSNGSMDSLFVDRPCEVDIGKPSLRSFHLNLQFLW